MSDKGEIKEGARFVKEEMNEHGKSSESQRKAQEGRDLRNEGRVEDGKAPRPPSPARAIVDQPSLRTCDNERSYWPLAAPSAHHMSRILKTNTIAESAAPLPFAMIFGLHTDL
jgi:hypothetical protein